MVMMMMMIQIPSSRQDGRRKCRRDRPARHVAPDGLLDFADPQREFLEALLEFFGARSGRSFSFAQRLLVRDRVLEAVFDRRQPFELAQGAFDKDAARSELFEQFHDNLERLLRTDRHRRRVDERRKIDRLGMVFSVIVVAMMTFF